MHKNERLFFVYLRIVKRECGAEHPATEQNGQPNVLRFLSKHKFGNDPTTLGGTIRQAL